MADLVEIRSSYDDADSRLGDAQVVMGMIEDVTDIGYGDPDDTKVMLDRMVLLMPLLTSAIQDARDILENNRQALIAFHSGKEVEVDHG
jgi:hypothetical protein